MATLSVQSIVNGLADQMGLPVMLEDATQQLMAYSPHYDITDRVREETILRRSTAQRVVDWFAPFDIQLRDAPFVVPGDPEQAMLPRLCIPIRYADTTLGYAWVLLPAGEVDADQQAAAEEAQAALSMAMLAESRSRTREGDSLLSLVSPDAETRIQGLIDVEARGSFDPPRQLSVVVCSGPDWDDAGVRGAFWTAAWTPEPQHQMRAVTPRDGIVLLSGRLGGERDLGPLLARALSHVAVARSGNAARLALGVGGPVEGADAVYGAYREARLAARVALRDTGLGPIAWWSRLGVHRFLSQLPTQTLADAVDPRITRLVGANAELARTLEVYLAHGGAITAVAEALHIHRTTLYYRLERLVQHGFDLGVGADRLTADASLAALRLLGRWPPPRA